MPFYNKKPLLGLAVIRPICALIGFLLSFILCFTNVYNLLTTTHLDTISVLLENGQGYYEKIRCWTAREHHASVVISQMTRALCIFQIIQMLAQVILIPQKRWARTAKALSVALISATLAGVIVISVKSRLLVKELEATGPFPEVEEYCSTARAQSRLNFDIWSASNNSRVRSVVIVCTLDCALKVSIMMYFFVLRSSIRIPIPFEPIVTGSKAQSTCEDDINYPENGPASELWKKARQRALSKDDACITHISTKNDTSQPLWVLSRRLTRMPAVVSRSPCFSVQIQHWTHDRYRRLTLLVPLLAFAIFWDILPLIVHFCLPSSNKGSCTSLCKLQIASLCWKPVLLFISYFMIIKKIDLQKYNIRCVSLRHIMHLLWCTLPLSFLAPIIPPFLSQHNIIASPVFFWCWVMHTMILGVLWCFIVLLILTAISTTFRHSKLFGNDLASWQGKSLITY